MLYNGVTVTATRAICNPIYDSPSFMASQYCKDLMSLA
jgi:hypothetical protein